MFSTMLFKVSAIAALTVGVLGQSDTITAGTPVSAASTPTGTLVSLNSDPLLNEIYNYYGTLATQSDIQTLYSSFISAVQTDIVNYAAASPTQVLAELPGLLSIMNPIFAQETPFYSQLLASETSIEAAITSIVSADQAEPTKMVGDLVSYMGALMAEPTFVSFINSFLTLLPTDAASYLAAQPSLILIDQLPLILSAANPIFTAEPFYASLTSVEAAAQAAMTSIVAHYDATKWASVTGTATMETATLATTLPASVLGNGTSGATGTKSASASVSIAPFKGEAAPKGELKAMAAVGAMVLGFAALL
ncbi:hypothetical protein MMC30_009329 [Trapelia coarctata]|nr:hypothetical protein [Trapelia coarctata]